MKTISCINRRLKFYDGICKNIKKGRGSVFKVNINVDTAELLRKLNKKDIYSNQLDKENKTYKPFAYEISYIIENGGNLSRVLFNIYHTEIQTFPLIFCDKTQNIVFYDIKKGEVPPIFTEFRNLLSTLVDCELTVSDYDGNLLCSVLEERIMDTENFYVKKNGEFINKLFDGFGDDISRASFETFIEQKIIGGIQCGFQMVYPFTPPKITRQWRDERLSAKYDLPIMNGANFEELKEFFYKSSYKLEQYAVRPGAGICEVEEGDIVIDAGTYIGDTALYFAQKTGKKGKVYAFEPIMENIRFAERNLKENGLDSIAEIIPYALSDKNKVLYFTNRGSDSNVVATPPRHTQDLLKITAVSLDNFVEEREIKKVDFLKADLEGSDVDFVKGALKTIARDAPKCGLCVYHTKDDFITIPKLLMSARDDYVFYFRCEVEPVLFAKKRTM